MPIKTTITFPGKPKSWIKHEIQPGDSHSIPYLEDGAEKLMYISCGKNDLYCEVYDIDQYCRTEDGEIKWEETSEWDGTTLWCGQSMEQNIIDLEGNSAKLTVRHIGQFATYLSTDTAGLFTPENQRLYII